MLSVYNFVFLKYSGVSGDREKQPLGTRGERWEPVGYYQIWTFITEYSP